MKEALFNRVKKSVFPATAGLCCLTLLFLLVYYWGDFVQYCFSLQVALHRYLVLYLLQQQGQQMAGGILLTAGSFIYGVLHSVGPGHGKFVITTWLATHRQQLRASHLITLSGSLMQGIIAILFVVLLAVALNLSTGELSHSRYWIEKINALLIALFGLSLVCRAMGLSLRAMLFKARSSAHDGSCSHRHHPTTDELNGGWRDALWIVATIGIRPCSGALMILVFANAIGMFSWGIIAVMAMSLGTALSIIVLATAVHYFREWAINANRSWATSYAAPATKLALLAGGVMMILFALLLFNTVIPASANGDYITAGC